MYWKPIETANLKPKKALERYCETVLLLVDGCAIQGEYDTQDKCWDIIALDYHGCGCCGRARSESTHWMPLPILAVSKKVPRRFG